MDSNTFWHQTLQSHRAEGVQLVSLGEANAETALHAVTAEELPSAIAAFLRLWKHGSPDLWQVLIQSAATLHPDVTEELTSAALLEPFHALLARAEQGAIGYWPATHGYPFPFWGYLFQIRSPRAGGFSHPIVLHTPASAEEIHAAEAVLRLSLPPSYRRFLQVTNSLTGDVRAQALVYGAGPKRADWTAVLLNRWLECDQHQEIAASWRAFQGVYDYERIRDWENGEHTFLSDETTLVPFGYTYETWCFDRSRPGADGDYPIIFWGHETRQARDAYPDFSRWFAGEIESYLFG
ncbi:MAG: SMI1/KNR4 family protein [Ktedonobacteraceae bacterium]